MKLYGTYAFDMGLNLSLGLELESGAPLTAFAAHPVYDGGGEIPLTARGAGFQTSDGFQTRTPWTKPVNVGASYNLKVGSGSLRLIADLFNVFNSQTILDYNSFSELQFGVPNPDFGAAGVSGVSGASVPPRRGNSGSACDTSSDCFWQQVADGLSDFTNDICEHCSGGGLCHQTRS